MGARENGEERNEHSTDVEVERDAKQAKEAESDYEASRDSFSSQGESNSNEDTKAKRVSRVPKKLAKKETKPNSSRLARSNSTRPVNKKLQYISPNNSPNKSLKPSKAANGVKPIEVQKAETVEVTSCPSSDVSEETNDKAIEGRATDDKSTEGRADDDKATEGTATDDKATEGTAADDKAIEGVETDDKANEGRATDHKSIEVIPTDDKAIEVIATDDKGIEGLETGDEAIEEAKEIDVLDEAPKCDQSTGTDDEIADTEQNILDDDNSVAYEKNDEKIEELESKIEKLEQELREVAALEVSLYSIVPEHVCSSHKLHTPARRLSRLYIYASKFWSPEKKASVAKNSVSGLVLVAKSCGNDVSRLTFWLSNTIVLREIVAQTFGISSQSPAVMNAFTMNSNSNAKKLYKNSPPMRWKMNSSGKQARSTVMQFPDDWQETGTVLAAHARRPPTPTPTPRASTAAAAMERRGLLVVLVAALCLSGGADARHAKKSYQAVFSFGDSLSDAGNLIVDGIPKSLTTARAPYGMTFFGRPTGRCSNGRVVVDFLAEHFGLPLPPASQAHGMDFKKGANFAITGATALEYSFFKAHGIDQRIWNTGSINTQIGWLQKMKPSLCKSEKECKDYFSKSLFVVGEFGGNDYNAPLFSGVAFSDVKTYVPLVAKAIANGVEKLIELGATDLLVPGILPIGCFPLYLTLYNSSKKSDYNARTGCLRRYNRLAFHHNRELKQQLDQLQKKYPKTKIMYGDYFKAAMQFVVSPGKFGFSTALQACCGAGGSGAYNFNLKKKCGEAGASVCSNPSAYVSWDGIHMTEAAYRMVANGWLNGPYASPPIMK